MKENLWLEKKIVDDIIKKANEGDRKALIYLMTRKSAPKKCASRSPLEKMSNFLEDVIADPDRLETGYNSFHGMEVEKIKTFGHDRIVVHLVGGQVFQITIEQKQ